MRYSVLFVTTLILISGFIAYFGDILGRRMGKRRLTLFNLRPRYTAIVVTTITGMIISALAVGALVAVNSQFRKVLTHGEQILVHNRRLSSDNARLSQTNRSLLERRAALIRLVAVRQKEVEAAKRQFHEAAKARDAARRAVAKLEREIADRKRDIEILRARKLAAEYELDRKSEELVKVHSKLVNAQKELKDRQADLINIGHRLTVTAANLDTATAKLAEVQKRLNDTEALLAHRSQELKAKEEELIRERKTRMWVEQQSLRFLKQAAELRGGELVLRQGDELARGVITPKQTLFGIKADLLNLLEEASKNALERGAGLGPNGRAVNVIFRSAGVVNTNESACLEDARNAISRSPVDALVRVVCAENTIAGEQVPIELLLYFNNLVFRSGELIAQTKLDGRVSEGRVLLSLINFLQTDVATIAVRRGVVPMPNYDPRATMGVNPRRQLEGLLAVVEEVKTHRSKVDVRVYASQDIYAVGPLNMDNMRFSVEKAE